uniref:NADH-ubiquinone oxidoreductase chain 2 n=1 Tax=Epilampra maya TaxID=2093436 RepID=A0A2P1H8P2_9NEOP|nr:NADH dehydrogenase subunit 2 [Epilampra maya]
MFFTLIGGMMITISSNSWLGAWMGLEINLLSFIPIMSNNDNIYTTEASLNYFLIQALASATLLFIIISKSLIESMMLTSNSNLSSIMISTPLLLKSGAAPLHWWFPSVMEGLSWSNCLILMTIQKMSPLMLISYSMTFNNFMTFIILSSVIIGSIGGYNQVSIRKILTYSSINHLGWMLSAMIMGENMWIFNFLIYSFLTATIIMIISPSQISFVNQTFLMKSETKIMKFLLFSTLLSLGGLPPFLGFLPKWMIIQFMVLNWSMTVISLMVITSLITLYYYLRIAYSSFIILSIESNWSSLNYEKSKNSSLTILFVSLSMMGLLLSTLFINLL